MTIREMAQASMEALSHSTVHVRLSTVHKMEGEAKRGGMKLWRRFDVPE